MCGIFCFVSKEEIGDDVVNSSLDILKNRGPDARAARRYKFGDFNVLLGHTRLSILDLSVLVSAGNFRSKCHSGNSSFHHLLEHDLLLLVVSPRSFASIAQRYFLPLIGSLR